jgi:hypothetical protein
MMRSRLLRAPALHFLCLGACLLMARTRWDASARSGPTASDEDLLYQEALTFHVDTSDRAVRERLARLGGFVGEDAADEATLEDEARRLGLARSDLVVRRHLVQMMRLAAERLNPDDIPTDAEIATRAAAETIPARTRFTHVYLKRTRPAEDAARILTELRSSDATSSRLGDAFALGADIGPLTDHDLDQRFGPGFAAAIAEAPVGTWTGPIPSTYGTHLVRVTERLAPTTPPLESVRGRITHELLRERRAERASERLTHLRDRNG